MSDQELRVAEIGGNGHFSIAAGFGAENNARLVAIAADGHDEFAKKYLESAVGKDVPYFENYRKMLREVKPDVVSIGSQPARNARVVLDALERGMHVVSDKPIANNARELARIRAALETKPGLHLLTEFTMRVQPPWMAMREAVRGGKIGDVALLFAQKSYRFRKSRPDWYKSRKSYPGTLIFAGSHMIDMAWWVTGLKYARVQGGLSGNIAKPEYLEFDDHAAALFELQNGAAAAMTMDFLRPEAAPTHGDDRMRIAGSKGVIEVLDDRCTLITHDQPPHELAAGPHDGPLAARELIETLRGRGQGVFSTADSLYIAEVLLKARQSADTGRTVRIAD